MFQLVDKSTLLGIHVVCVMAKFVKVIHRITDGKYCMARKFDGVFNLMIWRSSCQPPN